MYKPICLFFLLLTSWWSTGQEVPPQWPDAAWSVLPSFEHLQAGVVNKYYFHYFSDDKYDKSTDIQYHAYELLPEERLQLTVYNPGLEKISEQVFEITPTTLRCLSTATHWYGEQLETRLESGDLLNFVGDSAHFVQETTYPNNTIEYRYIKQASSPQDTSWEGRAAKQIHYERQRDYSYTEREDRSYKDTYTDLYVEDIGLVARFFAFEQGTGKLELVKQLSMADFEQLRASVPKRVGYIDPELSMDRYGYFQPCGEVEDIHDYYNGEQDAGFKTGKRGLEKILRAKLDPAMLSGESGYLTFRFVINCEGETGWFVTEEATLDFQPQKFARGTVQHVYEVLKGLRNWQPGILRGEVVDTYAYVTLKIRHGEIVDILP